MWVRVVVSQPTVLVNKTVCAEEGLNAVKARLEAL